MPYGDSDGSINGRVYFQAKKNHALFESADKIKSVIKKKDIPANYINEKRSPITTSIEPPVVSPGNKSINQSFHPLYSNVLQNESQKSKQNNTRLKRVKDVHCVGNEYKGHKVNTRVVYFDDNPDGIHGTLRFLGYLDKYNDDIYAVVETVRQLVTIFFVHFVPIFNNLYNIYTLYNYNIVQRFS